MRGLSEIVRGTGKAGLLLTLMLWVGVNTGPWVFRGNPHDAMGWIHYVRALLPLVAAAAAVLLFLAHRSQRHGHGTVVALPGSLRLWGIYALLSAIACARSPRPWDALYWAVAYAAVLSVPSVTVGTEDASKGGRRILGLNSWTWGLAACALAALLVISRGRLVVESGSGPTAYGVVHRVGQVGGMAMSRSSGFARLAAIPAILGAVLALRRHGVRRVAWGGVALISAALVYLLQSRGAIVALAASIVFLLSVLGGRTRLAFALVVLAMVVGVLANVIEMGTVDRVEAHLTRGQGEKELQTMTGRTRAWRGASEVLSKDPWLGFGPQADRYVLKEHVHNTVLHAWLGGGFLGALAVVGGFVLAWRDMLRSLKRGDEVGSTTRTVVLVSAGLLVFFTVRGIPEVSGAMFGVDLLVLVPVFALLGIIGRSDLDGEGDAA